MKHISIIEDDAALNNGIALALGGDGYSFSQYFTLGEFDASEPTDLIILDINLPDGSGFELLRKIRQSSDTPVIILTANDLETDEVTGLTLGADDYITKPFSLMVLRARIEKALNKPRAADEGIYSAGACVFDFDGMEFTVGGESVLFSRTEQKLLRLFTQNTNRTLTRERLIDRLWTDGAEYVDENALSVTVGRLRKKLGDASRIQTVYGVGYVWRTE